MGRMLMIILIAVLIIGGITVGIIAIVSPGLLGIEVQSPVDIDTPTTYDFLVLDFATGEELEDVPIRLYATDTEDLSDAEIADLTFGDYVFDKEVDSGDNFVPDEDTLYWGHVNTTDIVQNWFQPILGLNTIRVMNETEDVSMLASADPTMVTTVLDTVTRNWDIETQTIDADESDPDVESTIEEGFLPYYDFETDTNVNFVIRLEFNQSASLSYAELRSSFAQFEKVSGNYLYYEIDEVILGNNLFEIRYGSGLDDVFGAVSIAIGYGSAEDFTLWDSQN